MTAPPPPPSDPDTDHVGSTDPTAPGAPVDSVGFVGSVDPVGTAVPFDAVVLAGGRAARLGGADKPGVRVGGRALLERVLAACAGAGTTVVVAEPRPTGRPVVWAREEPVGGGPLAALDAGLRLTRADLVVVLSADLPFLREQTVRRLVAALCAAEGADGAVLTDPEGRDQPLVAVYRSAALRRGLGELAEEGVGAAGSGGGGGTSPGWTAVGSGGGGALPDAAAVGSAGSRGAPPEGAVADSMGGGAPKDGAAASSGGGGAPSGGVADGSRGGGGALPGAVAAGSGGGRGASSGGAGGVRGLSGLSLRRLVGGLELVRVADSLAAFDCDTWDDIAAARARIREHGHVLDEWITAVKDELGIELDVDTGILLDLARDAAHGVARPAAPLTTFLVGYAAAQATAGGGGTQAVADAARKAAALAARWAEEDRPDATGGAPAPSGTHSPDSAPDATSTTKPDSP
ncbi:hypothetical protein GCM10012286_26360 [Streptomyces lasiicapitis]|uniref:Molybdenum cofactor guanylyltransferase n=1 Tax=Streptomyces lasiicapitis TaxID=1923961 RepID=A0ABQ2LWQ2_9ACTN|nr:NTP transferase domain-containing protein [Streptomyces lasiicapitis]GGO43158.1 hypothetical protein GCM10012286_26360 [Streptomyces lasiicapitis]